MQKDVTSPSARVQNSFRQLSAAAANLNSVSDELGKSIEELDAALKKLNLGVTAWALMSTGDPGIPCWSQYLIGYTKVGGKWGIVLRVASGNDNYPEDDQSDEWLFNDAPRWLRLEGIEHVPALIEKLIAETEATTENIKTKVGEARELAEAINAIAAPAQKKK